MMKKIKRGEIAKAILACIGIAGILVVGVVMPNIFSMIPKSFFRRYRGRELEQSLRNLKKRGLVQFVGSVNGWRLSLTKSGRDLLREVEIGKKILKPRKKWDKKWRLLIFDIEEKRRNIREKVRRALISFGFYRLQDSVWVYPHECKEILELLRIKYGVRHDALYLRVEYLDKDNWLLEHFNLKK